MEQALIRDALRKGKHPALEVPYAHTIDIGHGTYWPEGQWEYIDAVIEEQGMFTCLELKVSISDIPATHFLPCKVQDMTIERGKKLCMQNGLHQL